MAGRWSITRIKAGDPIKADLLNTIVDRLWPLANLTGAGPYLMVNDDPYCGKLVHLAIPQKTAARLTSNSSPYSWEEVDEGSNGTWVTRAVGGSGTNDAYEINNVAGLSGKVYSLTWTGAGDYRFQAIRVGCNPASSSILITITDFCTSAPVAGATVTIKFGGSTVATGSTDGSGHFSTTITKPGNYTIDVSSPDYTSRTGIAFNGVACGKINTQTVVLTPNVGSIAITFLGRCDPTTLGSFPIPGATVTVKQGATTIATGTTNASGQVTIVGIPISGSAYTVTATNPDYSTQTGSQNVFVSSPCSTPTASMTVDLDADYHCACWRGSGAFPPSGTCLVGNQLQAVTPWGNPILTWNNTTKRWVGTIEGVPLCAGGDCTLGTTTLTIEYGFFSGSGCGWQVSGPCTATSSMLGGIPGGGTSPSSDTGGGSCSPFYAWTTITWHLPNPWAGLIGKVIWCPSSEDPTLTTYTFSVTEIPNP